MRCSSSPLGWGLAFRNRLNASRTSAEVQGFGLRDFLAGVDLAAAFLGFFGADFAAGLRFGGALRVILAMIRVY